METQIGRTIKVLRTALGIKQRELARRLGISANYLSMIEAGKREPTLKLLRAIGSTMQVPVSVLLVEGTVPSDNTPSEQSSSYQEIKNLILQTQRIILESRSQEKNE